MFANLEKKGTGWRAGCHAWHSRIQNLLDKRRGHQLVSRTREGDTVAPLRAIRCSIAMTILSKWGALAIRSAAYPAFHALSDESGAHRPPGNHAMRVTRKQLQCAPCRQINTTPIWGLSSPSSPARHWMDRQRACAATLTGRRPCCALPTPKK